VLKEVSIIIPAIKGEPALKKILEDFEKEKLEAEIIVSIEGSRAVSLNIGANKASRDYLWFLHADTDLRTENFSKLENLIKNNKDSNEKEDKTLSYFDLAYTEPGLTRFNAFFANIRSFIFGLPYGDQGLFVSKKTFQKIGNFPEDASFGEDMLFVRIAKSKGIKLNRISSKLFTSARKYKKEGWLKLTCLRQVQMCKLLLKKV